MRGFAIAWVAHICNGKRFWVNGKQVHFGRCIWLVHLAGAVWQVHLAGAFWQVHFSLLARGSGRMVTRCIKLKAAGSAKIDFLKYKYREV